MIQQKNCVHGFKKPQYVLIGLLKFCLADEKAIEKKLLVIYFALERENRIILASDAFFVLNIKIKLSTFKAHFSLF